MKLSSIQPKPQPPSAKRPEGPAPQAEVVAPIDTYPMEDSSLVKGDGWAGINKPIKVRDAQGNVFVAKSNTLGAFIGLHPDHDTRTENIHEIVASHIVADEFKMPSLTFQEGYLVNGDQKIEKVLSPLRSDFQTLEHASVKSVKDGDAAVALTVLQGGLLGDWDSTFNDSNVWVRNDGVLMGADYGYAMAPGIECVGVPYANIKVMKEFATEENVKAITDKITNLSDEEIHGMVDRVGRRWIHDWSPKMEADMSSTLIANRDALKKDNPFLDHVQGFHPGLKGPLLKLKYPRFFYKASHAKFPWKRPDQALDVLGAVARYAKKPALEKFIHKIREHVPSPEQKPAQNPPQG